MADSNLVAEPVAVAKVEIMTLAVEHAPVDKHQFAVYLVFFGAIGFKPGTVEHIRPSFERISFFPWLVKIIISWFITDHHPNIPEILKLPVYIGIDIHVLEIAKIRMGKRALF